MIEEFMQQIEQAEQRYRDHTAQREERQRNLRSLGQGGDWRKIDEPRRIVQRLESLGMQAEAAELMESATRPPLPMGGNIEALLAEGELPPAPAEVDVLERIIGTNELITSDFLVRGAAAARSVGRVVIRNAQGRVQGYGTGFLVSPVLLMTNNHVLDSRAAAENSLVQFNYSETLTGDLSTPVTFRLQPARFFRTDSGLDFTLVAVAERNLDGETLRLRGWSRLIAESGKILVGERVNIIQHPGGERQQLALRMNQISDLLDDFLHYSADTERGSSGSPVFNDQWELAALHHAGVPQRDESERILLVSGDPWDGSSATVGQIAWKANEGARVSRIVAHLRELRGTFSRLERQLYEQAFLAPPDDLEELAASMAPAGQTAPGGARPDGPRIDEQGNVVWTIPLEVRVGLGGLNLSVPGADRATPVDAPPADTDLAEQPPAEPPDLQDALQRVDDFANRPYYQPDQDETDREAYYQGIDFSASRKKLYQQLHDLLSSTHTTRVPYDSARKEHLYPWVDLHQDDGGSRELRSVYSGKDFSPEEVLREDLRIEAQRETQLRELMQSEATLNEARLESFLETLEAQLPYNCEHVVPQSWFNKAEPMKGDLHHLFTCESGCNSFRSNIPYYQFSPEEEAFRDDCGQVEKTALQFEPASGKGPVARATFYFLLRYPGLIGDELRELQLERLPILLDWHAAEPVGEYERHRNATIFEIQGNRNPFIDFPELVEKVDLKLGFGMV